MCNNATLRRTPDSADAAGNREFVTTLTVPTKGAASTDGAPKKVIDTRYLSEGDLKALKKQDPFLYYSIPLPVRRSSAAHVTSRRNQDSARSCSQRVSCPSLVESSSSSTIVERKSCISVECDIDIDIDLILEDFMDDAGLFGEEDEVDFDTETSVDFDQLLLLYERQQQYCVTSLCKSLELTSICSALDLKD